MVAYTLSLEVQLSAGVWTTIADVIGGIKWRYGISGNGPLDRMAGTGDLRCALNNSATNAGGIAGWYSPASALCRSGWGFDLPVRVRVSSGAYTNVTRFRGTIREIDPAPGLKASRLVSVVAYDGIRALAESAAREVALQTNKTEAELITAVLDALPASSQPIARDLDTGVDSFPYAFDNLGEGAAALAVLRDLVVSSFGLGYIDGAGTFCYRSRHSLATASSVATFTDNELIGVSVPSSLDGVVRRVRVTVHPKTISAAATEVLYAMPAGNSIEVPAGETREVWTAYNDPNDRQAKIGGAEVVGRDVSHPLVAGTHYAANSAADGSGSSLNSSVTVTLEPFASTAKWTLTNGAAVPAFFRTLSVIGKALRDPGPQTFESDAGTGADRSLAIDLPYQDDPYVAQSAADYIRLGYGALDQQVNSLSFIASSSAGLMAAALTIEIGDLVTVSETITGLSSVLVSVRSIEFTRTPSGHLICALGVAPADTTRFWQWGVVGASEWGATTVYAF